MKAAAKIGLVLATVLLSIAIYFIGDFKGKVKEKAETPAETPTAKLDYQQYKTAQLEKLDPANRQVLTQMEQALETAASNEEKISQLNQLIAECEKLKLELLATMYSKQIAEVKNDAVVWDKTGTYFMDLFYNLQETPDLQVFKLEEARYCFEKATKLDTANLDYKVRLGVTFMEDQQQTMQGVTILRGVVDADSNHISANLYLGRFGIISGQYDKAEVRLKRVLGLDSTNVEAHILMADVQVGLGNKDKAIEYLLKVKQIVADPAFAKSVDEYIEKIKNS